ncbi:MAG: succinate dehydrogenase, hydrophobic membrane anchor protein [Xanthomonadales bacterium]|nr:succinate dehydrogenase, hydrophobic membrane anchor protein [Xanthomonadales bacterium]
MKMRHPLAHARGLGSAKSGTSHWWGQRVTALLLIPLVIWMLYVVIVYAGQPFQVIQTFFRQTINSILAILLVLTMLRHAQLGMQVVIEDYVHSQPLETILQLLVKLFAFAGAVTGVLAVIRLAVQ